jgi:hypothetical protein
MEAYEIGKSCKVSFLEEIPCVLVEWFELPPSSEFRKGCDTALEVLIAKKVSKILVDNSHAKLFAMKDQQWLNENWLPRAEAAGYHYSATVLGDSDAFVKFAAQSIAQKRDQSKFKSKFFKTKDEAITWLKSL